MQRQGQEHLLAAHPLCFWHAQPWYQRLKSQVPALTCLSTNSSELCILHKVVSVHHLNILYVLCILEQKSCSVSFCSNVDVKQVKSVFCPKEANTCTHLQRWTQWASSGPASPGLPASQRTPPCGQN